MENYQSSNKDFSEYIKINDDGTKELCLDEKQLSDWPEGITDQMYLEGLHLRDTYLTKLPEDINKLINLKVLKVDGNKLKHLPDSICDLTELKELSVNNNQLSCLPTDILDLAKLEKLNLSVNNLTNLPDSIGDLKHLRVLNVSYNQLSRVPTSIQQLTELEQLDLGNNKLEALPDSIGGLKELRELSVYTNLLSTVPTSIHLLTKLQRLNMNENRLTSLPDSIGELNELKELSIDSNQLSIVPNCIQQLTKLQRLNLDENNLKNLPDSIGDLKELRELSVSNNQLSIVPNSIQHLTKLQRLHLDGNKLKDLPDNIGALKELKELSVNSNQLSIIPDSFKQLTKLQRLNLDRNKLRDLPDSIGCLMELQQSSANSSQLSVVPLRTVNINDPKGLTKLNVRGNPLMFDAVKRLLVLKLERPDIGIDIDVPAEIESRGEKVQRAYIKALSYGFVKVYRGRILVVGQQGAGKTCLKKNLLGLPFDANEKSTDGIQVDPSKVEIDVDQVKKWQSTGKNEQFLECSEAIAKLMIEKHPHEKDFRTIDCLLVKDKKEIDEEVLESNNDEEMEEDKGDSHMSQDAESNVVGATDYTSAQPELNVDATSLPDEIKGHTNQLIKELRCEFTEKEQSVISMDIWDFAGQHVYYATHPACFSLRAIYLLVHNLNKSLNETAAPYYRQGYYDVKLENPHGETNLENLQSWLTTVHNLTQMRGEDKSDTVQRKPNYLRPPVFIVGTHADKPAENISNIKLQIERTIATKEYVKHVVRPIFIIDNTGGSPQEDCKIDTIQALRNRIMEVLKQKPYMGEKIPVRWILFEKVTKALVAGKSPHLSLRQLRCYAKDQCFIEDDAEFDTMMQFYHDLGIILKHRETVILDVQWLINLFKHLITVPHFEKADPIVSREWLYLDATGVLSSDLIDHVFCKFVLDGVVKEDVLHLMEQFGLIAKFSPFSTNVKYFVPAQLPASPDDLCVVQPSVSDPCPLYLLFVGDFVPHGLFTQLVARCIQWCSNVGPIQPRTLYRDGAWFVIGSRDFSHSFYLIHKKQFIKLVLKQRTKRGQSKSSQVPTKVLHFVAEALQGFSQDFPHLKGLQYHFGVECPHCQQQKGKCKEHRQESCKDCLHLLKIKQGVPLSCENNADEEVKVPGLEKWFFQTKIQELHVDVISQVDLGGSEDKEMRTPAKKRGSSHHSPECLKQRKLSDDPGTSGDDSPAKTWTSSESKRGFSSEMILHDLQKREFDDSNVTSPTFLGSRLDEIALDKGFKISHNEGLGNCMFYALSEQLDLVKGIKIPHNELRKHIVQYLKDNPTSLDRTELFNFVNRYQSWDDYLKNMAQEGTWGDNVILHAVANYFHTCIDVVSLTHHQDLRITPEHDVDNSNQLVLGHVHELHYVSLRPIKPGAKPRENKFEGNPPQLSVKLPKKSELPKASKPWSDVALPIDILLLTVEDCELLSCFYYLDKPFKSYCKAIGYVFFGSTGSDDQEKLKIALIQCAKWSASPGGSLTTVKNAVKVLRPKAVFSVGACTGLSPVKTKLGDVVVSSKLTTPAGIKTPVGRNFGHLIRQIGYGWVAPLENPDEREVTVHCNDILSHPQAARHEDLLQPYPEATAFEREGEGFFAEAYDGELEWGIVKGVASFGEQSSSGDWVSFASAMAASVVANILSEPIVFREWPHYRQGRQMLVDLQKMQYGAKKKITKTKLSEDLKKVASNKGFVITENEGSGNCMFYALSHQLHHVKGISISHEVLRQRLVQYLWDNPRMRDGTRLFNFVSGYPSWADYLRSMATDGTWGDHIVLHAAADYFETCILVISTLSRDVTISPKGGLDGSNPLVLGHMHEGHYVSLLPSEPVAVKEGCPSDDELEELSEEIGGTWMKLGHRLDLRKSKLTGFHKGHEGTRKKAYAMLLEWKKTGASNATYRVLYEALSHKCVSRKDLAMKICCKV